MGREPLGVGLIGSGFMGRCHANAFRAVGGLFDTPFEPALAVLADIDEESAARAAAAMGFARATADWRALIADEGVDLVDITAPNPLHQEMALAAITAGKPVYCEKPLAPTAAEAGEMVRAAERAGIKTMVGFNYLHNPITGLAKAIIDGGEIGRVYAFRGIHAEDYMADPQVPYGWRFDPASGPGVIGDLASHIISLAQHLIGPIDSIAADWDTVHPQRPAGPGKPGTRRIAVADQARAMLRFASGARGAIEASWVATGRKMTIGVEITGTKGSLRFDFERLNELELYTLGQPPGRAGYRTILAGPEHPPYGRFTPAPGHQLGFNEIKVIEVARLLDGLAGDNGPWPDFRAAWETQRVADAMLVSADEGRWVKIDEI